MAKIAIPVKITADTERKILSPKVFDDIDTGEILPNERILSGDFFNDLSLPTKTDREILDDSALSVEKMAEIKTRLKKYIDNILPDKIIAEYEKYEKQSAALVSIQFAAALNEEKVLSVQSEIRLSIKYYKELAAEIETAKELLQAVEEKIESAKEKMTRDVRKNFASRLKTARKAAGLTQTQLADKVLCTLATIAGYEVGRREPSLMTLTKISQVLGKPIDWFLKNGT